VGEPAPIPSQLDEPPLHDPASARQAYQYHRARRAARIRRRRERRWARLRFWFMLGCLLLVVAVIGVLVLQQVQNIFGI
jgi:type VI protein secretion system component VasF